MAELRDQVQEFLDELVASGAEVGLQAAVYRRGELLVDAVAGPGIAPDTLFYAASTAKGVTATVVRELAERGLFGYDTPIVELWPEFGAHGKRDASATRLAAAPTWPGGRMRRRRRAEFQRTLPSPPRPA